MNDRSLTESYEQFDDISNRRLGNTAFHITVDIVSFFFHLVILTDVCLPPRFSFILYTAPVTVLYLVYGQFC